MDESKAVVHVREEVIPRRQRRIWFDWRNFLLIAGMSLIGLLAQWVRLLSGQ